MSFRKFSYRAELNSRCIFLRSPWMLERRSRKRSSSSFSSTGFWCELGVGSKKGSSMSRSWSCGSGLLARERVWWCASGMCGREALLDGVLGWDGGGRRVPSLRSSAVRFPRVCLGVKRTSGVGVLRRVSTYERTDWSELLGVVGGDGDLSGCFILLAGILITFLILLDSILDAILLS